MPRNHRQHSRYNNTYHNEHNKVHKPCAVINHPFHFTVTSCTGLDPAIIQDCLGSASKKMSQLMHPSLPCVKQECIVRKGLNTEEWSGNDTAGDYRSTGNKDNNTITCQIRIREGYQDNKGVIEHELAHGFFTQYSPHERGGWGRLFEELPQYIAVSDHKGGIPDEYCQSTRQFHKNNMHSFDDILHSNVSVYTRGPVDIKFVEDTNSGAIRDHIICVNDSHLEYNNCDVKRDECRDMNQPFKERCDNARSECYSNLSKPCTDAYNSCLHSKDNERVLCTEARDKCWPDKSQRALCEEVSRNCDAKIVSSYPECENNRALCTNDPKITHDNTCHDESNNCLKQNEPFQQHCDEDKKKCNTKVDEKCLTPLRDQYNAEEFNKYLKNGCHVDISFHNLPKGPKYFLEDKQVITTIPSPPNYPPKIIPNTVIPHPTTTPPITKITTSKISAPNSLTSDTTLSPENGIATSTPAAVATASSMFLPIIIAGVVILLLIIVCGCSCYIYKRYKNNKKASEPDIEQNINQNIKEQGNKIKFTKKDNKQYSVVQNKVKNEEQAKNKKKLKTADNNSLSLLAEVVTSSAKEKQKNPLLKLLQDHPDPDIKPTGPAQNSVVAVQLEELPSPTTIEEDDDYYDVRYPAATDNVTDISSLALGGAIEVAQDLP